MYSISKYVSYGKVIDETIVFNYSNNKIIKLDKTSQFIWECIVEGLRLDEIVNKCCIKYNCFNLMSQVKIDVINILEELKRLEVLC